MNSDFNTVLDVNVFAKCAIEDRTRTLYTMRHQGLLNVFRHAGVELTLFSSPHIVNTLAHVALKGGRNDADGSPTAPLLANASEVADLTELVEQLVTGTCGRIVDQLPSLAKARSFSGPGYDYEDQNVVATALEVVRQTGARTYLVSSDKNLVAMRPWLLPEGVELVTPRVWLYRLAQRNFPAPFVKAVEAQYDRIAA